MFKTSLILAQNDQIFLPITEPQYRSLNTLYPQEKDEVNSESFPATLIYRNGPHTKYKVLQVLVVTTPTITLVLES